MASAIAAARRALRHLARIRYRLLLVNVLVAAVPVGGIAFAEMHERQLLAALERDMIHQAQLVRAFVLAGPPRPLAEHERMLARAARDTRTRIRLLDAAGEAVADSHRAGPPEGAEPPVPYLLGGQSPRHAPEIPQPLPLAERREVRQALAGRYGSATRLWSNKDRVYLFAALPVVRDGRVQVVVYVTRSTQDVKLQLLRLRAWLVELLAATVLAAALLSLLLAMTIERPLVRLRRRAQRIAAQQPVDPGAPDERLTERADEIGELARAVAAMTDELQRRAHDARTLAADLSHELKNPLAGIRGAAELLRDGAAEEPEARDRFLGMIVDDAARLDRIVSRLLEVARVEDDRGVALPVDLAALARACADRPWPVPVDVTVRGDAVVAGRGAQLAAAIENLVANATQHAEPGSRVEIELAAPRGRAGALRLTVGNRGPALSEAARRKVWDRFYSTRTAAGGSGLGLAIVRSVALAHGGSVGVACAGGVTSFWIELPRST
ncbi:MAG TPA: ATP-binding protein [Kofleriaceae bacterium]|nr:ATP-binding protein [Kofleriaceae bacterium]